MRAILAIVLGLSRSLAWVHADDAACTQFAWSFDTEKAWFAAPDLPSVRNGEAISLLKDGAIKLELQDLSKANLPKPPEKAAETPNLQAGYVTFATLPKAGLLQ